MSSHSPRLTRTLRLPGAVAIGLGSMIGAGVFVAFAPAAQAAGSGLLIGLVLAAVVATANALSTARLAAEHPVAGGAYAYGRQWLGGTAGFVAGWGFVIGKSASAAAMARTVAAYLVPPEWQTVVAVVAALLVGAIDVAGVRRTAAAATVLVVISLGVLAAAVAVSLGAPAATSAPHDASAYGVLQSAGILFFAFAGYARVATLGEEVVDPARTIPRAVIIALAIVLVVYAIVALALLRALGGGLGTSSSPVADAAPSLALVVGIGAGLASLGSLLSLVAGIGRTSFAMAREGDLPAPLARAHGGAPRVAEVCAVVAVAIVAALVDLRGAIAFSSFAVLVYYLVANLSALRMPRTERRMPAVVSVVGTLGCVALVVTLPWHGVVAGVIVLGAGVAARAIARSVGTRRQSPSVE